MWIILGRASVIAVLKDSERKDVMERTENPLTRHQKNITGHC